MITTFFYNSLLVLILLIYIPHLTVRGKWHKGLLAQLGFLPKGFEEMVKHPKNIWVHAVSVGEILAVEGVLRKLKDDYSNHQIILSTVTRTGYNIALERFSGVATVIYAPFDFSWVIRKYVKLINPCVYIAAETEIWPGLYQMLNKAGIAILVINGRISDSSYKGYRKIKRFIAKTLDCVNQFCMQSDIDVTRIVELGADGARVKKLGNLKFDTVCDVSEVARNEYGFSGEDLIFIAGSTHPGEEKIILKIFKELAQKHGNLKLILAPRHVERVGSVKNILAEQRFNVQCLSEIKDESFNVKSVLLVDTIGQLRLLYSLADVVFVGKTLVGRGGQNILEPASYAKPIIVGPNMENFKNIMDLFLEANAVVQVGDEGDLKKQLSLLLDNSTAREELGSAASRVVSQNVGATQQTLDVITQYIR